VHRDQKLVVVLAVSCINYEQLDRAAGAKKNARVISAHESPSSHRAEIAFFAPRPSEIRAAVCHFE
jgi:hypothetical protein